MKKTLFILSLVAVNARAQTIYPSGVTNCIARWDFASNGSVTSLPDVSGNENHSSEVEDLISTASWRGLPNQAMRFNGSTSYALIPNSSSLTPESAVTMVALVQADGFYTGTCQFSEIIVKGYPGYIPGQYGMGFSDDVYDGDCSGFDPEHHQLVGYFNNSYYTEGMLPDPGNYVTTGKWYFLAIAFDGTSMQYYQVPMDTATYYSSISAIYSSTFSGSLGANDQDISIGKHLNPDFPYWFNGKMDEVALFDKVLTVDEVQSVYDFLWHEGTTGTADVKNQAPDINIYPNPSTGSFTVTAATKSNEIAYLEVRNTAGQLVYSQLTTPLNGNILQHVDIPANTASGNYFLVLRQADKKAVKPITIVKN